MTSQGGQTAGLLCGKFTGQWVQRWEWGRGASSTSSRGGLLGLSDLSAAQRTHECLLFAGHTVALWGGCSWPEVTLPGAPDPQVLLSCPKGCRSNVSAHLRPGCAAPHCGTLIRMLSSRTLGLKPTAPTGEIEVRCTFLAWTAVHHWWSWGVQSSSSHTDSKSPPVGVSRSFSWQDPQERIMGEQPSLFHIPQNISQFLGSNSACPTTRLLHWEGVSSAKRRQHSLQ